MGCSFVVRWVYSVGARVMCGGRCGAVRRCPGKRVVWRGCGVRLLVSGCPGRQCHPWAWVGFWPVVGVELARGVWGFQGWCWWGGDGMRSRRGVALFLCCFAVVFHVLGWGRGVRCGMVVLGCVAAFAPGGGAPCPGLVGWLVARGWSSGGVGQPCASSWSSLWCVSVRGPCGFVVVWGLGSPEAGCVGLECRNQGGVVAWCLGVSAHR